MNTLLKIDHKYQLIKNLGGGLSGEVLLVEDSDGNRFALKFLKKVQLNVSRDEALRNFKNEFAILKELNHPNIARILDFGYDEQLQKYYFTSELIDGAELHKACEGQPVDVIEKLLVQVLRALNYLHSRNVYHFDIKPQNILVSIKDGVPQTAKIIDFGLAALTSPQKRVGTPSYMSPEMIEGGVLDGRTDIYSMGVVIYQALTGQNPFTAKTGKETLHNQLKLVPPLPSQVRSDIPKYWDHIVERLIEKSPAQRYTQASFAIRDLSFLSNKTIEIETKDTKLSYLPEKGALIGRDAEWKTFVEIFGRVFLSESSLCKHILFIEGPKGSGKTRLLSEIKYDAQLKNVAVRTNKEIKGDLVRTPCVVLIDSDKMNRDTVNTLLQNSPSEKCLIVCATESAPKNWANSTILTLKTFTTEQIKQYIEAVTGLGRVPQTLVEDVAKRTSGNPLLVAEFVKLLLDKNILCDENGKWEASTFDDIKIDLSTLQLSGNIEEHLMHKWKDLDDVQKKVLIWFVVHPGSLTISQITELTQSPTTPSILHQLCDRDLITVSAPDNVFTLKNPSLAQAVLPTLPTDHLKKLHDQLAQVFEKYSVRTPVRLYHKAHGSNNENAQHALQELGMLDLKSFQFDRAIQTFLKLINLDKQCPCGLAHEARMRLAEAYTKTRHYNEALEQYSLLKKELTDPTRLLALNKKIVDVCLKKLDIENAEHICRESQALLKNHEPNLVFELIFKNFEAAILIKRGKLDEAKALSEETYEIWKNKLADADKMSVDNNRLLEIYPLTHDFEKAIAVCQHNIALFEKMNEKYGTALTNYALGDLYYQIITTQKHSDSHTLVQKCLFHFESCEHIAHTMNDLSLMLRAFNGMGNIYAFEESYPQTLKNYKRALTLSQQINDRFTAAIISFNTGNIHLKTNNIKEAYSYLVYAINTLEYLGAEFSPHREINLFWSHISLSEVALHQNNFNEAAQHLAQADDLRKNCEALKPYEFWSCLRHAQVHLACGNTAEAQSTWAKAKSLASTAEEMNELKAVSKQFEKACPQLTILQEVPMATATNPSSNEGLKKIIEINKFINAEYNTDQLLKIVLNYALQLTNAEAGFVLLLENDNTFSVKASINKQKEDEKKISQSIAHEAIRRNELIVSSDALTDERFDSSESVVLNELKSVVCLPIRSKNKSIGVFYLDNRTRINAFEGVDLDLLNAFCDQVGIAIENSTLINNLTTAKSQLDEKLAETTHELDDVRGLLKTVTDQCKTRYSYKQIIAQSVSMQNVFKLLDKVTDTNLSVFICGESGTGKELIAKCLHFNNPHRASKRFVAINCGAIPMNLMESELFGHKAGSFTGASKDQKGLFEEANGGTIFLDEISELDTQLQVKLLRVLQEGEVQRVGDSHTTKVDVRVVCASHKDLATLTKEGKFREDLYYRLCQMKIDLPPLRNRPEDITLLAQHFVDKFRDQNKIKEKIEIPTAFMKALLTYQWTGNVRELENLILVACALREGNRLAIENLPPIYALRTNASSAPAQNISANLADVPVPQAVLSDVKIDEQNCYDPSKTWQQYEAVILAKCYDLNGRKKAATASMLGLSHSTIYNKISELKLDDDNCPFYAEIFVYTPDTNMKAYIHKIFQAALTHHGNHPYAAIKQLNVSQGYFYKVMREMKDKNTEVPPSL